MIKQCAVCGGEFECSVKNRNGRAKTCSQKCGVALKRGRRKSYLAIYNIENREFIRAQNADYYQRRRERFAQKVAEATVAMQIVRGLEKSGVQFLLGEDREILPACAVCNKSFRPRKYRRRYTLCGDMECHREWSRRLARKRWHGLAPEGPVGGANCRVEHSDQRREAWRRYAEKARYLDPESCRDRNQKSASKRASALRLVRELQSKGLEALI